MTITKLRHSLFLQKNQKEDRCLTRWYKVCCDDSFRVRQEIDFLLPNELSELIENHAFFVAIIFVTLDMQLQILITSISLTEFY